MFERTAFSSGDRDMFFTEITDDLTGAVDSGSYFTGRGQRLRIYTSGSDVPNPCHGEIHSFNLSSRNVAKQLAGKLHYDLLSKMRETKGEIFMKKIGTGFRGNDPYELEGLLKARQDYVVFIIDNAPELGTFTLYGNQYCEGEILHKSLYANDPIYPPTDPYIPRILAKDTQIPVGLVDIDVVKGGDIRRATAEELDEGKKIIVFDAVTDKDTLKIISELMPVYDKVFWTGSLGIANGLAEFLYGPRSICYKPQRRDIRCLCFSASDYDIAKRQIEYSHSLGLKIVCADIDAYIDGDGSIPFSAAESAVEILREHNVIITPSVRKYSKKPGTNVKILECIGTITKILSGEDIMFDRLLIVGGETAQTIYKNLGVGQLELGLSLEPGVAEGHILDGIWGGKEFVMKGGSMGDVSVLEKMMCRRGDANE
ncbi:four-carbon acid sugar kinase family protein [Cloacibacillus sp. An23]|uniref:four-carbon acid sugar kinase family protein n=1 Tax=Cloacibacillus sp. An23 TaxID=1965591 RepID=UPI001302AAA1|nr:four-carbon acid sugar kinase family protein [Cloacibacillus sp. An23]